MKTIAVRFRCAANGRFWLARSVIGVAALLGSLARASVARAQTDGDLETNYLFGRGAPAEARRTIHERSFAARPLMLELRGGVSTIVGLLGATVSFDPWSRLSLGAGLGGNTSGIQIAAFARLRPLVFTGKRWARLHAIGVELGYSTGAFSDYTAETGAGHSSGPLSTYAYDRVQWLQPQISYETRSYRGLNLLLGVGVAIPLATQGYQCLDALRCSPNQIGVLPTFTFGLGWAMEL